MSLKAKVDELNKMISEFRILEAFDKFYADDVVKQENNEEPRRGKAANREFEKCGIEKISEYISTDVKSLAVNEDTQVVVTEWEMNRVLKDGGNPIHFQVSVQTWRNGKIIHEKFYYKPDNYLLPKVTEMNDLITQFRLLEAFEKFYADDVVIQENNGEPRRGKDANREFEKREIEKISKFISAEVKSVAVNEDAQVVVTEWEMNRILKEGGNPVHLRVSVQKWKNGKIIQEKFYYKPDNLLIKVKEMNEMIMRFKIMEAFEKFYAEDVIMKENNEEEKVGKALNRELLKEGIGQIAKWYYAKVKSVAVNEDEQTAMTEWEMHRVLKAGGNSKHNQVAVQKWKDGKIIFERFYYSLFED